VWPVQAGPVLVRQEFLPVGFALTGAKADERPTLLGILQAHPTLVANRPGQNVLADKHYYGKDFEPALDTAGIELLRRARQGEPLVQKHDPIGEAIGLLQLPAGEEDRCASAHGRGSRPTSPGGFPVTRWRRGLSGSQGEPVPAASRASSSASATHALPNSPR
jgi:hypothetical protein